MTAGIPGAVADPADVTVDLVCAAEPGLDRAVVAAAVAGVWGGRAKQRKLAQALVARPSVLTDGRSPAPRVIGDLLIALRKAGATVISPPACAGVRQAASHHAAPRAGLVLRRLRPAARVLRGLRQHPAGDLPRPGRAAAVRPVPAR